MADVSQFRRQLRDPLQEDISIRGFEAGRAATASQMDQFYAQLNQMTEQFEKTLGQRESEFGRSFGLETRKQTAAEEQFEQTLGFEETKLATEERLFGRELAFREETLESEERRFGEELAFGRERLGEESERWRGELEQLRAWQSGQLKESAAGRETQERMFETEQNLRERQFGLEADIRAPLKWQGPGLFTPGKYVKSGATYSKYGTTFDAPVGGETTGSRAERMQTRQLESEQDLVSKYFARRS